MNRPVGAELLFREDECLRNDPDYLGIHGWWKKSFPSSSFREMYDAAIDTEIDGGDIFTRVIKTNNSHQRYLTVTYSYDGYAVYKSSEKEASHWRMVYHEKK